MVSKKVFEVIRELEKYITKHVSLQVDQETKVLLEKLVTFCKKHISSKVLGLIESINHSIINRYCSYILNTYPRPVLDGDSKNLNILVLAGFDSKIADTIVARLKLLSPQLGIQDQISKLKELRITKEKTNDFERDKEMITLAIMEILTGAVSEFGMQEHKKEPLFDLPLSDIIVQKQKESSSQRENRLKERASNREFLNITNKAELKTQVDQKIIQIIENAASHKAEGDQVIADTLKVEDNYTNKRLFGWINLDRFLLKTEISFKKLFSSYISLTFEHLVNLERFEFKIFKEFCPPPKSKNSPSQDISTDDQGFQLEDNQWSASKILHSEESLNQLYDFAHQAFKQSLISLAALFFVLDHFSYLFTQQNSFSKDILSSGFSSTDELENLKIALLKEIQGLGQDSIKISGLPDKLNIGIFQLNLSNFKNSLKSQIIENKKNLKKALVNEMKSQLEQIESGIKYINNVCNSIPSQVDEYIEKKKKLESDEFQKKVNRLEVYSLAFDTFTEGLENLQDLDDAHELVLKKLFINTVLKTCFESHKSFIETFKNSRLNFYDEISLHRLDMLNEFSVM